MYITKEFYRETFKGLDATDEELDRYIKRASDKVDIITNYQIGDINNQPDFAKNAIQLATSAQVEFYVVQGGPENTGDIQSVRIGNFQYTDGQQQARRDVSNDTLDYLKATGLLYRGLKAVHYV